MVRVRDPGLLLGEWACLAVLAQGPAHGFAVARRMAATGDVGRAWSLSRPLTYRALDALVAAGLAREVGREPGRAGGERTVLGITAKGRRALTAWLAEPVTHLRDVRGALMVKLLACELAGVDPMPLVAAQLEVFEPLAEALRREAAAAPGDPVPLWRAESSAAAVRFLQRLADRDDQAG
jgi:DNA-binding PadR family transcriptional regulator